MTTSPLQGGSLPANLSNLPGMVPPAGETPNFDNPYSRGETFTAVATTITVVMIILVINREYTKYFIIRKLGWDDLTCLLGALAATGYYISSLYEVKAGRVGIHQWNVRLTYLMSDVFLVPSYVVVILVPPAMIFTKLTFFLVYLQIFQPFKWLRTCVYLGATVTTLFYVVTELFWIVAMTPIKAQTFLSVGASPAQLRALVLSVPTAAVGLGIDVYLLVLPVTAVMQLQLPTRHKIGVILIFLTGIAAVISSALSVYYRTLLNTDADITWNLLSVNVLSIAEMTDEVEISADASASKGQMSVLDALKGVLKLALIHDGLARGLREASKALDRRQAHMCVLNEACEEEAYKKLVVALCSEHKIPLIKVPDGKQLGEWAGLCVLDREGNARKVVNCSCVVVRDWGEESQERSILLNYFQTEQ
ncbi:40s ribosomal protein s12 [Lasallia pustulata]|uniref:40S ribosomal protein S12 n=1 Tax=Lasallia pustulata TaxID=136370 RepID=A0A1W5CXI6_9LECA|nr:40s ribosomal protein s12 [Lasallia pustulata]